MPRSILGKANIILATIGISLAVARAQAAQAALQVSPAAEQEVRPAAYPDPRYKLPQSPQEIYDEITSKDADARSRGMKVLFRDNPAPWDNTKPVEADLRAVQLDDDPDMEYILVVSPSFLPEAFIVDKAPDGWYSVGDFHSIPNVQGHYIFIQTRGAHGTQVSEYVTDIYGLWKGSLYHLLGFTNETYTEFGISDADGLTIGTKTVRSESSLSFDVIVDGTTRTPTLTLRDETTTTLADEGDKQTPPPTVERTCEGYEWVPATFSFERTDSATKALCK